MACGSVRVWLALLPPLPVWKQNLPVLGDAASPPSGCVTTRMTVAMVRMRSVHPPALQTNSAVPACQGESKLTLVHQQASFLCRLGRLMTEGLSSLNQLNQPCCKYYILSTPQNVNILMWNYMLNMSMLTSSSLPVVTCLPHACWGCNSCKSGSPFVLPFNKFEEQQALQPYKVANMALDFQSGLFVWKSQSTWGE